MIKVVNRFDNSQIKSYEIDNNGYLRFIAPIAKVGNLIYYDSQGGSITEYVTPECLIDSIDTFKIKPITKDHILDENGKPVFLDSSNTVGNKSVIGFTGNSAYFDGSFLWFNGTICDQESIDELLAGSNKQISSGYSAIIEQNRGRVDSLPYDARLQVKRYGNHVAKVSLGRAGEDVAFKVDGVLSNTVKTDDKIIVPVNMLHTDSQINLEDHKPMELRSLVVGSDIVEVSAKDYDTLKRNIDSLLADLAANEDKLKTVKTDSASNEEQLKQLAQQSEVLQGKLDAATAKIAELEATPKVDSATIQRMTKLISEVSPHVDSADLYSLTEREIKEAYLKTRLDNVDFSSKSDDYVSGMYDQMMSTKPVSSQDTTLKTVTTQSKVDSSDVDPVAAKRQALIDRYK